eukprot:7816489-Alexandrium_andersonii.AAC.1
MPGKAHRNRSRLSLRKRAMTSRACARLAKGALAVGAKSVWPVLNSNRTVSSSQLVPRAPGGRGWSLALAQKCASESGQSGGLGQAVAT